RYGTVVLDLQPICCRLSPGSRIQQIRSSELPNRKAYFSEALLCNYTVISEKGRPVFYLFDTEESFEARRIAADVPCIALWKEFQSLKALRIDTVPCHSERSEES
ncbi:MAG: hypothetical protein J5721_06595, partial [Lachnospiraceae bacterium]|nr:hypothetical protein [Lachnospiraceae bacterium]